MHAKSVKDLNSEPSQEDLINDLIKEAEDKGLEDAVKTLKEFKKLLKDSK